MLRGAPGGKIGQYLRQWGKGCKMGGGGKPDAAQPGRRVQIRLSQNSTRINLRHV